MTKQAIVDEIKRTAKTNRGIPLGSMAFFRETGIKKADWYGKYWVRWGDALQEAGLPPNRFQEAYDEAELLSKFVDLIRELGRFPVEGELRLKVRQDPKFPSHSTFRRFGSMQRRAESSSTVNLAAV